MKFISPKLVKAVALSSVLIGISAASCAAVEELIDSRFIHAKPDALVGDWQGTPGYVAQVFPSDPKQADNGKYTVNVFHMFDVADNKPIAVLQGTGSGDVFTFEGDGWTGSISHGHFTAKKDGEKFDLYHVKRVSPTMGAEPPAGAVVLLDKHHVNADAWATKNEKSWLEEKSGPAAANIVDDGEGGKALEVVPGTGGGLISHKVFGDAHIHVEFRTVGYPSNSGVFLETRYEADINENYGKTSGSVQGNFGNCAPAELANTHIRATRPVLEWNTFDFDYQAPRFSATGDKIKNAHVVQYLNGVKTYDIDVAPTKGAAQRLGEAPTGPLYLQEHGMPAQFRNIWIQEK